MLTEQPISAMIIFEVLQRWPQTAAVFRRHNMGCIGCAVAPFFTIADAATIYRIPIESFAAELELVISGSGQSALSDRPARTNRSVSEAGGRARSDGRSDNDGLPT
jgi:hybrid cluster-associated redox disulfide protein